jgi:hypothetical protein
MGSGELHTFSILAQTKNQQKQVFNNRFRSIHLDSYKICVLKAFSTDGEQLVKGEMQYLEGKFAAAGNSLSLATSVFDTFSWPSATVGLQEFVNSKI